MTSYRLQLFDRLSGRIEAVEEFDSADDVEAFHLTRLRCYDVPAELWRGGHKVARFDARSEQAVTLSPG
jgi:hypothetical protein